MPGTFSIFYHYALGKTSAKKANDRSLSFILGVEIFISFAWLFVYAIIFAIFYNSIDFCPNLFFWIISGIFLAESIAILFFYFRRGKSAALFIPRCTATALSMHAKKAKTRSDAITLGFFASLPELIFTLPLYIISAIILLNTTVFPRALIILLYILVSIIPLFIIRFYYSTGHNLAEITRFRVRLKPILRLIISFLYFFLAIIILNLGVINYG